MYVCLKFMSCVVQLGSEESLEWLSNIYVMSCLIIHAGLEVQNLDS